MTRRHDLKRIEDGELSCLCGMPGLHERGECPAMTEQEQVTNVGPYPFCRTPEHCNTFGYCPNDPACNN